MIMRISDLCLAFPGLVFAMGIAAVLNGGLGNAVLALAAVSWPKYARLARSQTLAVSHTDFMDAARLAGGRPLGMIRRHILPNILGPILVTAALDIGAMMMELAGLSFLGLGAMPPTAEWGSMMSNGRSMLQTYPWVVMAPGAAIFVTAAIFNLFGDALRDYLDPKKQIGAGPGARPVRRKNEKIRNHFAGLVPDHEHIPVLLSFRRVFCGGMILRRPGETNRRPLPGERPLCSETPRLIRKMKSRTSTPTTRIRAGPCIRYGVGETLFRYSDAMELEPWLAESWEQADADTWVITLRGYGLFYQREEDGRAGGEGVP